LGGGSGRLVVGVGDRGAAVEDEALTLPTALGGGNVFEVLQDAALEVKDLGESLL
jgi:hypothetical protein